MIEKNNEDSENIQTIDISQEVEALDKAWNALEGSTDTTMYDDYDFVDDFSPFDKVLIEEDFESPRDLDQVVLTNPKIHAKTEEENKQQPHAVEVSV